MAGVAAGFYTKQSHKITFLDKCISNYFIFISCLIYTYIFVFRSTTSSDAASVHEAPPSAPPSALSLSSPSLAPSSPSPNPSFLRPRPANQQSRAKRLSHLFLRGRSNSDRDRAIGEHERELWAHSATPSSHHYLPPASSSAPGLVKIYGDALSSGANYRSLLANIHSTARQLIQQVITRYTERERENENEDIGEECHTYEIFYIFNIWQTPLSKTTYIIVTVWAIEG